MLRKIVHKYKKKKENKRRDKEKERNRNKGVATLSQHPQIEKRERAKENGQKTRPRCDYLGAGKMRNGRTYERTDRHILS